MKKFELPEGTYVVLSKSTPRKECHGDQHVQAISLRMSWTTTNDSLDKLHPQLKAMLYWKTPTEEAQERIEGLGADDDDDSGMPPGTHDEAERAERRDEAAAASRARMRKNAPAPIQ